MYSQKGAEGDDVLGDLRDSPASYAGYYGAHLGVLCPTWSDTEAALRRPRKKRYCRKKMLKTVVFPQIAALLGDGEKSWFQKDLASPRTAKLTKAFA